MSPFITEFSDGYREISVIYVGKRIHLFPFDKNLGKSIQRVLSNIPYNVDFLATLYFPHIIL